MNLVSLTLVIASITSAAALSLPAFSMPAPETMVEEHQYSNAELDSLLAPIALYPDTLQTHILISATYPLDVVKADRWRQKNRHLTPEQVSRAVASFDWNESVKALTPFSDILHTMATDLRWLQRVGDNVLMNEIRTRQRIQILRRQALSHGNLKSTAYVHVEYHDNTVIIAPVRQDIMYVPYYNPHIIYGRWPHAISPVQWHYKKHYRHQSPIYWGPEIHLSTYFYLGGVRWLSRPQIIHRGPVKRHILRTYTPKKVRKHTVRSREHQVIKTHSKKHKQRKTQHR